AVARDVIDRVRAYDARGRAWARMSSSRPPARAQIFAFAHALLENDLRAEGDALLDLLEAIPVQDSRSGPGDLASALQIGIGDAVVAQLESRAIDGTYSWSE